METITIRKEKQFLIFEENQRQAKINCNTFAFYGVSGNKVKNIPTFIKEILTKLNSSSVKTENQIVLELVEFFRANYTHSSRYRFLPLFKLAEKSLSLGLDFQVNIYEINRMNVKNLKLNKDFCSFLFEHYNGVFNFNSYDSYVFYHNSKLNFSFETMEVLRTMHHYNYEQNFLEYIGHQIEYRRINLMPSFQASVNFLYDVLKEMNKPLEKEKNFFNYVIKIATEYKIQKDIKMRENLLKNQNDKFAFENENFIAIVPKTKQQFQSEGNQQKNCIYNSMLKQVTRGIINIVFIRRKNNIEKSYISCSIIKRGKYEVCDFLEKYNRKSTDRDVIAFISEYNNYLETI